MALLNELVAEYATTDLADIFNEVDRTDKRSVDLIEIDPDNYTHLKEVTLAQWLLESARATSDLAATAKNFAGLKWRDEMVVFATPKSIKVPSESEAMDFCLFTDIDKFLRGYWKFLTRSPYAGLEANTKSPENFIGFIQSKGFAADIGYVGKVLKLVPEARNLLATASGVVVPTVPDTLQVTSFPKEVEVGQEFKVGGTASASDKGKKLSVLIDNRFPGDGTVIGEDGKWQFNFVFHQAGDRKVKISLGTQSEEIEIKASIPAASGAATISLTGSVGAGGINKPAEKIAVKQRLHSLGFTFVGDPNSSALNTGFIHAIKLFQSIIAGRSNLGGDGRVDVGGATHLWLQAANAPRWRTMPDSNSSVSFVNFEKQQTGDDHDFGTSWMADVMLDIATDYHNTHVVPNPGAAPFTINDVSRPQGGDTPDHAGHETGLMCDVNLPRADGKSGGITWSSSNFDRNATRALIKSMRRQKLVRAVFFNDPTLRGETFMGKALCTFSSGHDNHIHFEINPPIRA
jgi:hypothetical protein